jgi:serine/threonine-protein kinase
MAFYEGETLKKKVERGRLPIGTAIDIAIQVAEGLERAHAADIVHRDIKPANLMLTQRDEVVIVDFGLAKLAGELSLTKSGSSLGTPHYMSPEQARGDRLNRRTDLWSLGVVLYEMLTGRRPFRGENNTAVARAILDDEAPLLAELRPEAPPELGAIVAKALEKDADRRYQSAGEFLADLRGLQDQLSEREGLTEAVPSRVPARRRLYLAPVLVAAVLFAATAGLIWFLRSGGVDEPVDTAPPRIVVLPFENLGSPDDEYFADGVTEEITSRLAAVSELQVISRTSARRYVDTEKSIPEIGEELDVGYVLEGTIRWDRGMEGYGRVRITPQLIRVADDSHLWSERYDRVLEDIFSVQSDIAEQVIAELQATLLEPEQRAIEARPTDNMEAYQAYLLGVQYRWSSTRERHQRLTVEMLERAVRLDPEFAVAHAMLSEAHSRMYHHRYDFTPERLEMARASAGRAMELQPGLPEAHLAFGFYYYWGFRDYDRALEHFEITAERLPNDPDLLMGAFAVLRRQGRWDQALEALERWQRVDPQGYIAAITSSITNRVVRDFEMAEQENRRAISIAPDLPDAYCEGAWNYLLWDGTTNRASQLLASAPSLDSPESDYTTLLLDLFERRPESAMARLEDLSIDLFDLQLWYTPRDLLECMCLSEMGDWQRAQAACSSAIEFMEGEIQTRPHDYRIYSALGHAYALLGRSEEAVRAGQRAVELMGTSRDAFDGPTQEIELAKIYTRVGQSDMALDLIEKLLSIPCDFSVGLLRLDPVWDPLRDHPRFQALLEEYDTE